jgi:hypothetical protein
MVELISHFKGRHSYERIYAYLCRMMLKKVLASCQGTRTETLAIWRMSMETMATGGGGDGREIKGKTRNLAMSKTVD